MWQSAVLSLHCLDSTRFLIPLDAAGLLPRHYQRLALLLEAPPRGTWAATGNTSCSALHLQAPPG